MRPLLRSVSFALALLASAPLHADVLVVDSGGGAGSDFADVQPAVDAAADGDVILVRSGTYGSIQILAKGVTIQADAGATVLVDGVFTTVRVADLPPGSDAVVAGLTLSLGGLDGSSVLDIEDCEGSVLFQDCTVEMENYFTDIEPGVAIDASASVTFVRCDVSRTTSSPALDGSTKPTIEVVASSLHLHDSMVTGGQGSPGQGQPADPGGAALAVESGFVFASGTELVGGPGGNGLGLAPFFECSTSGDGGPALALGGGSPQVVLLDSPLVAGAPGPTDPECTAGGPGVPSTVASGTIATLPGASRSLVAPTPIREGEPATFEFHGEPGDLLWWNVGLALSPLYLPDFSGVLLPDLFAPIAVVFLGAVPPSGVRSVPVTIQELGAGLSAAPLWVQATFFDLSSFVLANGQLALLLDGSF